MRYRDEKSATHSFKEHSSKQTFPHLCMNFKSMNKQLIMSVPQFLSKFLS